jgi:regulator of RNase E activity RraA
MTDDELEEIKSLLAGVSAATVQNQLFKRGLRNTFLFGIRPLNSASAHFLAPAFTLRYIPAREDLDVLDVFRDPEHPQRKAVESVPPGYALVMDCRGRARAASAGEILITRLMKRGVAAVVTDGSIRDSSKIARLPIPVFTAAVSATTNLALHHAADVNVPIGCADVSVYPGDILLGDEEGVVVIPQELASVVAQDAAEQEELERFIIGRVRDGASLPGTYPPNAETLALYDQQRAPRRRPMHD